MTADHSNWPDRNAHWRGRRVVVTGGAGFLGSFVVERLQAFHAVESMDNIRNVFRWQRVANELVNRICIVSDEYFCLSLLHQEISFVSPPH